MATPLKVLTALSASIGAAVSGSSGLIVQQGGLTVEVGGLTVNAGTTAVQGLTATTISGSSTLDVGGAATFGNNVTIVGDLTVNGTTTTINTENLLVEDKNIILGNVAGADDTTADGGGITLSGSTNKTFNWLDSTDSWTSSENMDLAASKAYKLTGLDVLNNSNVDPIGAGANTQFKVNKLVSGSDATGFVGVGAGVGAFVTGRNAVILSGSTDLFAQAGSTIQLRTANVFVTGAMTTNSTLTIGGASTLVGVVTAPTVTSSVGVSASVFVLADGFELSSSQQLGGGGGGDATKAGVESAYNAVRFVTSSVLDANGYVEVDLTSTPNGETYFATADLNKISVDVLTRPSGDSNYWNNDLVSVKLEVSASALWAKIDAPAAPNASYRLIAINESDFDIA